jgi:hypothetical protein
VFPSIRPFSMQIETKEPSYLENKTIRRHDAAYSSVELVFFTMYFTISSSTDFGFKKSKQ